MLFDGTFAHHAPEFEFGENAVGRNAVGDYLMMIPILQITIIGSITKRVTESSPSERIFKNVDAHSRRNLPE